MGDYAADGKWGELRFDHGTLLVSVLHLAGGEGDVMRLQFRGGDGRVQGDAIELPIEGLEAALELAKDMVQARTTVARIPCEA